MPFQKGNKWGKVSKKGSKTEPIEQPEEEIQTKPTGPLREAITMYREPDGWVVDVLEIQDNQVVRRRQVCPSTLKGEAIESFKLNFFEIFIQET